MQVRHPHHEGCLTADERAAVLAAWHDLQQTMQAVGALLEQADAPCSEVFRRFEELQQAFDAVEREIMRARQLRELDVTQQLPGA